MTEAARPMEDHVLVEVTVPAPADTVWAALRDPQQIKQWFGWDADGLADEIDFIFVTHAEADEARRTVTFVGIPDRYEVEATGETTSLVRVVARRRLRLCTAARPGAPSAKRRASCCCFRCAHHHG